MFGRRHGEEILKRLSLLAGFLAAALGANIAHAKPPPEPISTYMRLTTAFTGPGKALDIYNGGPLDHSLRMADTANVTGQYWLIIKEARNLGYVRLTSLFTGETMCLGIVNGGPRHGFAEVSTCGEYSGQYWKIVPYRGAHRLIPMWGEGKYCLDVVNGGPEDRNVRIAPCADVSGQLWTLTDTGKRRR